MNLALPGTAVTFSGAVGTVMGVTDGDGTDITLLPRLLTAMTENV